MRSASRNLSHLYDMVLAPFGVLSTQRALLVHVGAEPGITIGALASLLVIDRSAIRRNVTPLIEAGYLSMEVAPNDARSRILNLTPRGETLLWESRPRWLQAQYLYEASVGSEEALELKSFARTVAGLHFANDELVKPALPQPALGTR